MSVICKECGKVLNSFKGLTTHIQFKHNKKEYYDKYLKKENEGTCKTCGKPTEFYTVGYGYYKFCSKKCENIDISKRNESIDWVARTKKKEETNLKRYGVRHNMQRPEIMDQVKQTNLELYGVENVINNKKIQNKAKKKRQKTCMEQHGVRNYFQVPEVKEKIKQTFLEKYGVEHLAQDPSIFHNMQKHRFYAHQHDCELYYRGSYEKDFLDNFAHNIEIKKGLSFKYEDDGKIRVYHSDYYVPSQNLIVEIKNSYLAERDKDNIGLKKKATLRDGYNWIMIIDKNYEIFSLKVFPNYLFHHTSGKEVKHQNLGPV